MNRNVWRRHRVIIVNGRVSAGGEFRSWVRLARVGNDQVAEMWTYSADERPYDRYSEM